jgi:hypothetical protein
MKLNETGHVRGIQVSDNAAYMTLRSKSKVTGKEVAVVIDDEFLKALADAGREDLVLITEMLLAGETKIQRERAFLVASLVAIRELADNNRADVIRAFTNSVSTMIMERYRDDMLGIIGEEGMQRAAQQVSETLGSVIASLEHPLGEPVHKPEMEH